MFSYLRPHRRTPSTPTSPRPEQTHSWEPPLLQPADNPHSYAPRLLDVNSLSERPRTSSASPPCLPPIVRMSSSPECEQSTFNGLNGAAKPEIWSYEHSSVARTPVSNHYTSDSQPLAELQTSQWAAIRSDNERPQFSHTQSTPGQAGSSFQQGVGQSQGGGRLPFVTSSDIQTTHVPTGRRPTGVRMPTPPSAPPTNPVSTFEASQKSSSKTRLNLLNPMSLLARRRTSHPVPQLLPVPVVAYPSQRSPSDYDPRIRGTKVHDFSAPRPKRNISYDNVPNLKTSNARPPQPPSHDDRSGRLPEDGELSPWSTGRHTPVFKEDFEEQQYPAAGPHVRKANDFSDLSLPRPPYAREAQLSRDLPSKSNNSEPDTSAAEQAKDSADKETVPDVRSPGTTHDDAGDDAMSKLQMEKLSISNRRRQSKYQTSGSRARPRNVSDASNRESISGLLKHMKSNSSRFSFDMIGAASQEKLLEDRHREKALRNQSASPGPESRGYDDEEDDFDYDNVMDDDGLEERIPGVNADLEDEEEYFPQQNGITGFTFHPTSTSVVTSPMSFYGQGTVSTPRDAEGNVIGFALTEESPYTIQGQITEPAKQQASHNTYNQTTEKNMEINEEYSGLGLQGIDFGENQVPQAEHLLPAHQLSSAPQDTRQRHDLEEDDMYFDDGLIAHPDDGIEGPEFDESIFDNEDTDQYGRPLHPLSSLPTLYSPLVHTNSESLGASRRQSAEEKTISRGNEQNPISRQDRAESNDSYAQQQAISPPILKPTASLTQDTLSAYQSALAAAAYAAAANGRFRRDSTPGVQFDDEDVEIPDDSQLYSPSLEDNFDYDDAYEDDPIIAEANAEALAYDSDGFYSQEFGFYSTPAGAEALYANGGFFGPRGLEGLNRSQSARIREPNLTPITERSEYSNRNSIMSLPLSHGGASLGSPGLGAVSSPGLAQLAGMLSEQDNDNMSFSALLKLRSRAWGGSQASLPNSGHGSPSMSFAADENSSSSPAAVPHLSPWTQHQMSSSPGFTFTQWQQTQLSSSPAEARVPMPAATAFGHARKGSTFSLASDGAGSEGSSSNVSPKVQFSHPARPHLQTQFLPPPLRPAQGLSPSPPVGLRDSLNHRPNSSPSSNISSAAGLVSTTASQFDAEVGFFASAGKGAELKKHRHTGSSDSISYMKEDDPVAGERWVLERRRTAESGEVEVLGREVVSGGRI